MSLTTRVLLGLIAGLVLGVISFAAALYGIDVSGPQIAAGIAVTVLMSLASVGLPGEVGLMAVAIPIFQVTGVPLGPLALFLAVEMIPDMIGTVGNVTADMALTSMVARKSAAHVEPVAQLPISA